MSEPIDEPTAWKLVRAVPGALSINDPPFRVPYNPRPEVWLQVLPDGLWETSTPVTNEARDVLDLYLPLQLRDELTIAQIGQSIDGRIATETGHSHYVTGPADIMHLHRLRAIVDAVVIGAGTVDSDNPRLTVREVEGDNPVRVILDPDGRLERTKNVFSDGVARTIDVRRPTVAPDSGKTQGDNGMILTLQVDDDGVFNPKQVLRALHDQGLKRVLVEGGGVTVSRFLQAGTLDRLHVAVAPLIIGSGRSALTLDSIDSLDDAIRPPCRCFQLGDDILFDLDLCSYPMKGGEPSAQS